MDKKDKEDIARWLEYLSDQLELSDWQRKWFEWGWKHRECGGRLVAFSGRYEYRIGCTCEDKEN